MANEILTPFGRGHRRFSNPQMVIIIERWSNGESIRKLAIEYKTSWITLRKVLPKGNRARIRKCMDCPELLIEAANGKWKKRCDPCHIEFEYRERVRYGRKKRTGVVHEQYEAMLSAQQGLCAICRNGPTPNRTLGVDHDHATLQVRALLCNLCNVGLGAFNDDVDVMESAIAYLNKHRALATGEGTCERKTTSRSTIGNRDAQISPYGSTRRNLRSKDVVRRRYRGKRNQSNPSARVS